MKKVVAVLAPEPRSVIARNLAWVYAAILVVMALGQLYAFEKFIPLITAYGLPGGETMATVIASLIVFAEIFALPFLLRMRVSPLMRWFSLACSVIVPATWIKLSLFALITNKSLESGALLGAKIEVAVATQLVIALALLALALYVAYGLWPKYKR